MRERIPNSQLQNPSTLSAVSISPVVRFIQYLIFENSFLRITLGLAFSGLLFSLYALTLSLFSIPQNPTLLLYGWFTICICVGVIDQLWLCKIHNLFRKCLMLDLSGQHLEALCLLEEIGPLSKHKIYLPQHLYHKQKALVLAHVGRFDFAEQEIYRAREYDIGAVEFYLLRSELFKSMGDLDKASAELAQALAGDSLANNPALLFELGTIELMKRTNLKNAAKIFDTVITLPDSYHPCGEGTRQLAEYYLQVTRLWTGYAEEAIEEVNDAVFELKHLANFNEKLRPYAAWIILERAYYLATHKEPFQGLNDLQTARAICLFPAHLAKAKVVNDELKDRYQF